MKNLRFSMQTQWFDASKNPQGHAQKVIEDLGIHYKYAIPQSVADQWWFLSCENIPEELPPCITYMKIETYQELVGFGLSQEMADELTRSKNAQKEGRLK